MFFVPKKLILFCGGLLFTLIDHSFAQEKLKEFQQLSIQEGLPARLVRAIHQDPNGFMWIGAADKIIKYDGHSFRSFESPKLLHLKVQQIVSDHQNKKWILVEDIHNGKDILILDEATENYVRFSKMCTLWGYPEISNPQTIIETDSGGFYILTLNGGVYQFREGNIRKIYQEPTFKPIDNLIVGKDFGKLIHADNQLTHLKIDGQTIPIGPLDKQHKLIHFMDTVWAFPTSEKLKMVPFVATKNQTLGIQSVPGRFSLNGKKGFVGRSFRWDPNSQSLWAWGERSMVNWDWESGKVSDFSFLFQRFALSGTAYASLVDKNGQLWIGTGDGLFVYKANEKFFETFFTPAQTGEQISLRGITVIGSVIYANSYFGTVSSDTRSQIFEVNVPVDQDHFLALRTDDLGMLWSGHSSDLKQFDQTVVELNNYQLPPAAIVGGKNGDIWDICFDRKGKLWVGTEVGLGHLDAESKKLMLYQPSGDNPSPVNSRVYTILEHGPDLWLGTLHGLHFFDPGRGFGSHHAKDSVLQNFSHIPILHIYKDKDEVFWLATDGHGMIRWDREIGRYRIFNRSNALFDNHIHAIYEDEHNSLWLSSNNGVMRFDKETLGVQHFTTSNGLPHNEFNRISHYRDEDGNIYFGGVMGLVKFHPDNYYKASKHHQGKLNIHALRVLNRKTGKTEDHTDSLLENESIQLDVGYSGFELEVNLMDFMDKHTYAYKVDGLHEDWIYQRKPHILIAGLDYGKYNLLIKAQNRYGQWLDQIELPLHIKTPLHLTGSFQMVAVMIFSLLGWSVYKLRTGQIKKINKRLEHEVGERTLQIESDKLLLERQALKLEEQERQKAVFFANVSHDLRTPLTLINGPLEHILHKSTDPEILNLAQLGLQNAKLTLRLIDQLMALGRQEQLNDQAHLGNMDIGAFIKGLVLSFESLAQERQIRLLFSMDQSSLMMDCDPEIMEKIMYNLLSNAFKFTEPGGQVQVETGLDGHIFFVLVKDSGRGIFKKDLPFIFNRYYQVSSGHNHQKGAGLGLPIVQEMVKKLGGMVSVTSEPGKGSEFRIELPYRNTLSGNVNPLEKLDFQHELDPIFNRNHLDTGATDGEAEEDRKEIILIIDDNAAIRHYIQYTLVSQFRILHAENGEQGLQLAKEHSPDLIICDVKMPVMDGFTFCSQLKNEISISHIPVILLTAMADIEDKLKGLSAGADDYLYKPFNSKELVLKVHNLIKQQEKLAAYYLEALKSSAQPEDLPKLKPQERHFLDTVIGHIAESMQDESFGVMELSDLMCMSRKNLHRKIKALTGQSPSTFIRVIRLQAAIKLLQSGKYSVSEVSFLVGFNSHPYFSKCFQEYFGFLPKHVTVEG